MMPDELSFAEEPCEEGAAEIETFTVGETDAGDRLDVFLARAMNVSRSVAAALIEDGRVTGVGRKLSKRKSSAPEASFRLRYRHSPQSRRFRRTFRSTSAMRTTT